MEQEKNIAAVGETGFVDFARRIYPFLELRPFHAAYYRLLEAFAAGRIRKLMISVPPQHGKSVGASTLLPAYILGLDPDRRVAIASYSATLANKFNRRVQRIIESAEYGEIFPATRIKCGGKPPQYLRTADEAEIVGRDGSILSVGREGSLTGNRVDCFILDDLYKDAMEANSPIVRENCLEWYTSVVRTRMHNASSELIVFTRWHEEDLIGVLRRRERCVDLREWSDIDRAGPDDWLCLNLEAVKSDSPCGIDPRAAGEALWPERHSAALLEAKRRLDPVKFECMYQGRPSSRGGLLYGDGFAEYDALPADIVRRADYTDTADTGDDYLCSISYAVDSDGSYMSWTPSIRASRWRSPRARWPRCSCGPTRARLWWRATTAAADSRGRCNASRPVCGWSGSTKAETRRPAYSPIRPRCCIRCGSPAAGRSVGPRCTPT